MAKSKMSVVEVDETTTPVDETVKLESPAITPTPELGSPAAAPDPFDPEKLRLDQSFIEAAGVKKLVTTVPVGKPGSQEWIRTHPGEKYRTTYAIIEKKDEREIYLLHSEVAKALPNEFTTVTIYTCINRQGVVRLCPVRLPNAQGKELDWHRSMREGILLGMTEWVRIVSNMPLKAYDIFRASAGIPDPVWPDTTFMDLIRIGFRGRVITDLNHPLIRELLGQG